MDASTTALSVARHLKARGGWSQLTVITNGLRLASELAGHPGITVLMLGGRVRWEALSVVGQLGDGLFSRINVQKAFVGRGRLHGRVRPRRRDRRGGPDQALDGRRGARGHRHRRPHEVGARGVRDVLPDRRDRHRPDRRRGAGDDGRGAQRPGIEVRLVGAERPRPTPAADAAGRRPTTGSGPRHRSTDGDRRRRRRAAARRAARDLEAIRRDAGARRRLARAACRRGPRARRRERGRQEHAGQDPRRRPPARQRDDPARRRADPDPGPRPGPRARDRGRPPGATPLPGPDRRRERVHRPRPVGPLRDDRLGRDAPSGAGAVRRARRPASTSARPSAACRWPTSS